MPAIDLLEKLVIHLATLYDKGESCVDFDGNLVSDPDYDDLVRTLRDCRPNSPAFQKGSTSPSVYDPTNDPDLQGVKIVKHNPPMTSIAKADGKKKQKIYENWIKDCCEELGYTYPPKDGLFAQSFKRDGVACRIRYKNGKLVEAGLRPRDGVNGIDITANIIHVQGVPKTLPKPYTLLLQGELECHLKDFEKVQEDLEKAGEDLRANPRNHTYGAINQQKDPTKTKDGRLSFTGHRILGFDDAPYSTEIEMAKFCNQVLKISFVRTEPHKFEDLAKMEIIAKDLEYETDGIVLKVNNLDDQEQLGNAGDDPTGDPRGALAWKFAEESQVTDVAYMEWNANRTGKITPVAVFQKAVPLAGTMVGRATCSNYGWTKRMGIGPATKVEVIKAGKIIPKVISVVSGKVDKVVKPSCCPSCTGKVEVVEGNDNNEELMCLNENCPAKHILGFLHYFKILGCKGLGESTLEKIVGSGKVKRWSDLYTLTEKDLLDLSERQATLALATIHLVKPIEDNDKLKLKIEDARKKRKVFPAWQFFASLGISGAGKTAGKALIEHFGDFSSIQHATIDQLLMIGGIGEAGAKSIYEFFQKRGKDVEDLLRYVDLELPKTGKLSGKSFVLTGGFPEGKEYWQKEIEKLGGKCGSSVSKKTDYVVVGTDAGIKAQKADEYGIAKLTLDGLKKMVG